MQNLPRLSLPTRQLLSWWSLTEAIPYAAGMLMDSPYIAAACSTCLRAMVWPLCC